MKRMKSKKTVRALTVRTLTVRTLAGGVLAALLLAGLCSCRGKGGEVADTSAQKETEAAGAGYRETESRTNTVKIEMEDGGVILAELYPEIAPITVENFKDLVEAKFYDGLIFHRVVKNFMIQGGDPTGTGSGGSANKIKGEFAANGVNNTLKHERGVLSMARAKDYNSASSQFFICHVDYPSLNGSYAAFGKVISGMEVVDRIASVQTDMYDRPLTEQKIHSIRFVILEGGDTGTDTDGSEDTSALDPSATDTSVADTSAADTSVDTSAAN